MSKTKTTPIKAVFGFTKLGPTDLLARGTAVEAGVYGDPAYANLTAPIDKATFTTGVTTFSTLVTEALDGGKKAIAARNHQGVVLRKMLETLAHWVEANCNEDMKTFLASGFEAKSTNPTKAAPLTESIKKLEPGKTGEFLLTPTAIPGAHSYEARCGMSAAGATPTTWISQLAGKTRPPISFSGLTPGASYVFQVRAVTKAGTMDWSDPITRIYTEWVKRCRRGL